jgi:hypothetical protein
MYAFNGLKMDFSLGNTCTSWLFIKFDRKRQIYNFFYFFFFGEALVKAWTEQKWLRGQVISWERRGS